MQTVTGLLGTVLERVEQALRDHYRAMEYSKFYHSQLSHLYRFSPIFLLLLPRHFYVNRNLIRNLTGNK